MRPLSKNDSDGNIGQGHRRESYRFVNLVHAAMITISLAVARLFEGDTGPVLRRSQDDTQTARFAPPTKALRGVVLLVQRSQAAARKSKRCSLHSPRMHHCTSERMSERRISAPSNKSSPDGSLRLTRPSLPIGW